VSTHSARSRLVPWVAASPHTSAVGLELAHSRGTATPSASRTRHSTSAIRSQRSLAPPMEDKLASLRPGLPASLSPCGSPKKRRLWSLRAEPLLSTYNLWPELQPYDRARMAIQITRLGSPRKSGEGLRLGTVRRPPRGATKADYSSRNYFDVWFPELAPSAKLISWQRGV